MPFVEVLAMNGLAIGLWQGVLSGVGVVIISVEREIQKA